VVGYSPIQLGVSGHTLAVEVGGTMQVLERYPGVDFDYGGAYMRCSPGEDGVALVFLRGPVTDQVVHQFASDVGLEMKRLGAFAGVSFADRCLFTCTVEAMMEATLTQVVWGRLVKPVAVVTTDDLLPEVQRYCRSLTRYGVLREAFTTSQSFEALRWAQERAAVERRQAIYLARSRS
jgi:hypothetical protein